MATPQSRPEKAEEPDEGGAARRGDIASRDRIPSAQTSSGGALERGTVIAERYRIDALLGEGGMGKVYRAEHVHMRKPVAVKVLHGDVSTTPEVVARFEREAIAAGKISHPNVAAATDFGRLDDGSFFLVLEYVPGRDLRSVIKQGPAPADRAVRIVQQIVAAVGAAHSAGIIHRDLKPENIMLVEREGDEDFVKVLDFGIAKLDSVGLTDDKEAEKPTSGPQPLTRIGAVFGTPDYMSPEQALGQPIDARADLYSIGVMLYELLVSERPFRGGAVTLMRQHVLQDAPPLPAAVAETTDPRVSAIVQKLLQKSPQDRFANAAELAAALGEVLGPQSSAMAPLLGPSPTRASLSSMAAETESVSSLPALPLVRPRKSRTGLLLLTLLVVSVGGYGWLSGRSPMMLLDYAKSVPLSGSAFASGSQVAGDRASRVTVSNAGPTPIVPSAAPETSAAASATASAESVATDSATAPSADLAVADAAALEGETEEEDTPAVAAGVQGSVTPAPATGSGVSHRGAAVHAAGHPKHKPPSHTPPKHSGLYIPPPSKWFGP